VVSDIFYFHPDPWGNDPIWLIFSKGLKPPTRYNCLLAAICISNFINPCPVWGPLQKFRGQKWRYPPTSKGYRLERYLAIAIRWRWFPVKPLFWSFERIADTLPGPGNDHISRIPRVVGKISMFPGVARWVMYPFPGGYTFSRWGPWVSVVKNGS